MDAEIRAAFYRQLTQLFSCPNKEWAALNTRVVRSVFRRVKKIYPLSSFSSILDTMERELDKVKIKHSLEELIREYNRLFAGPRKLLVPPYESLYRYGDGRLMAPCASEVEKLYRENGLQISSAFKDLPDHICVELQFMAYLCQMEWEELKLRNEAEAAQFISKQDSFIQEHLGLWIDSFAQKLTSFSDSPFYSSLGKLASLFVKLEGDILSLYGSRLKQLGQTDQRNKSCSVYLQ